MHISSKMVAGFARRVPVKQELPAHPPPPPPPPKPATGCCTVEYGGSGNAGGPMAASGVCTKVNEPVPNLTGGYAETGGPAGAGHSPH
jgi:hypothetical protein